MKKRVYKIMILLIALFMVFSQNIIFASMADFTDEQADKKLEQEQKEWKEEQEQNIGKSSNNYLKNLSIRNYDITPNFDKQTINYEIKQEITENYIEIQAEADDQKASVSGVGKIALNSGENNVEITITAENGMVRTYNIKIIKSLRESVRLEKLDITDEENKKIKLSQDFDSNIFEYSCKVPNYVNKINLEAVANNNTANIEIKGNENLKEGANEILISITTDGDEKIVYKINVDKEFNTKNEIVDDGSNNSNILFIGAPILIVILITIFVKFKRR